MKEYNSFRGNFPLGFVNGLHFVLQTIYGNFDGVSKTLQFLDDSIPLYDNLKKVAILPEHRGGRKKCLRVEFLACGKFYAKISIIVTKLPFQQVLDDMKKESFLMIIKSISPTQMCCNCHYCYYQSHCTTVALHNYSHYYYYVYS